MNLTSIHSSILVFLSFANAIVAQQAKVDSALIILRNLPDSSVAHALNDSSKKYRLKDFDVSYLFAQKALEYALRSNNSTQIGNAYNYSGIAQQLLGNYPKALWNYTSAEETFRKSGFKKGLASTYINIGVLNQDMANLKSAIEYNRKAYSISLGISDSINAASALNNIATLHSSLNEMDSALYYNFKSLEIRKKLNLSDMIATSLGNIGMIYHEKKQYEKAFEFQKQSLQIDSITNNKQGMCISMSNMSSSLIEMNRNIEAKKHLLRAYNIAEEIKYKDMQLDILANLIQVSENLGEMKKAVGYSKQYVLLKDSIADEDTRSVFAEMQAKLDNTVQKNEIELLQKDKVLQSEQLHHQRVTIYFGMAVVFLFFIFIIAVYRSYLQKKKANKIITAQKNEVEFQKTIVEFKNKEILDSIYYAQRIQQAILLPESEIQKAFGDAFILFKPKDIVSGDFYWYAESKYNKIIVLADCTGHGVPGGFMSMLGFEILQDIVLKEEIKTTSDALNFLDKKFTDTLNKSSKSYRDGMDMALCALNKSTGKLQFSGANRPIIHISKGEFIQYAPDKHAIGGTIDEPQKKFNKIDIDTSAGDLIYLFSDGFADQFGGEKGKKFKHKHLQEIFLSNWKKPMSEQKKILETALENWKGSLEQVDDILVMGIKM